MALRNWADDMEGAEVDGFPSMPPGLEEDEVGRTYVTVSETANERARLGAPNGVVYKVD